MVATIAAVMVVGVSISRGSCSGRKLVYLAVRRSWGGMILAGSCVNSVCCSYGDVEYKSD